MWWGWGVGAVVFVRCPMAQLSDEGRRKLSSHISRCRLKGCACKSFLADIPEYEQRYPLDPTSPEPSGTWLWFATGPQDICFRWVCCACEERKRNRVLFETGPGDIEEGIWKTSNLVRHANSAEHKKNVSELLGKPIPIDVSLPSLDLFKDVFEAFQKGGSPSAGYNLPSGAIGPEKAHRMAWCLSGGDLDIRRESVRRCEMLEVMRDERHGRLHSRFSCTSASSEATHTLGYLGQARDFSPSAFGITGATKKIYTDFCTRYLDPPRGAIVEPCLLPDVYEHMRQVTEALAVDSAENEIVACREMSTPTDGMPAFTPNNRFILRDATHSGRRVLSRLFSACAVLRDILGLLVHWRDSLGQIIQHSLELRRIYKECCASTKDSAVSTEFAHMRAAKHRVETFLTPLSRMILDMTAYLATAVQISIVRKGDREGRVATCIRLRRVCAMHPFASCLLYVCSTPRTHR